mmetsp:Transcript_65714/g.156957  ORF Transcript_65714/g.156957 Transcript_65714/m.156957 type:complete len:372 (+) Transcript_65714:2143-3258(+)
MKQDRGYGRSQVSVDTTVRAPVVSACSEGSGNILHVCRSRIGSAEALHEAVGNEGGSVWMEKQVVQQALHLRVDIWLPGILQGHKDRGVAELEAPGQHHQLLVLVELALVLKNRVRIIHRPISTHRTRALSTLASRLHCTDLQLRQLAAARQRAEDAASLDRHAAAAAIIVHPAAGRASAAGFHGETALPRHKELVLPCSAGVIRADLAIAVNDDFVAAGLWSPHVLFVQAAAKAFHSLPTNLQSAACTLSLRGGHDHTFLRVSANSLTTPRPLRTVIASVSDVILPAGQSTPLMLSPRLVVVAFLCKELGTGGRSVLAGTFLMIKPPPIFAILAASTASSACDWKVGVLAFVRPAPGTATSACHLAIEEE